MRVLLAIAVLMTSFTVASAQSPGDALTPHRATYTLSLAKVAKGDGMRAAKGTLTYALTDQCEGYTIESDLKMETAFASGIESQLEQRFAAWEAKDGRRATFQMQTYEGGKLTKTYHGTVQLDASLAGTATFETDTVTNYALPPGTLLSTGHTLALLKGAAAGEHFVSRTVIDGSFEDGPFRAAAVLAAPQNAATKDAPTSGLAAGIPWPIDAAYFPLSSDKDMPDYEIRMQLLPNGVTRTMTQDFGNFAIGFVLANVEPLPAPHC